MCGGELSDMMNGSYEVCMVVSRGVVSLGSFMTSVGDERSSVALRVSMEVRREDLVPGLSPFGSLAMITLVGWMWSVKSTLEWRCIVMSLFQTCRPNIRGGRGV